VTIGSIDVVPPGWLVRGAEVELRLTDGSRVFGRVAEDVHEAQVVVVPWGLRTTMALPFGRIRTAFIARVGGAAARQIAERQREALVGGNAERLALPPAPVETRGKHEPWGRHLGPVVPDDVLAALFAE
jgi:hypothetical protein